MKGHAKYAPCSPAQLAARGYDYWALGHVHVPQIVRTSPHVVYSGNIQGRGVDETGPRGCYVVTVDAARRPEPHFVPLDDVRWARVAVPLDRDDVVTLDDVVSLVVDGLSAALPADGALLAARVLLTGSTPLHRRLVSRRGSSRSVASGSCSAEEYSAKLLRRASTASFTPGVVAVREGEKSFATRASRSFCTLATCSRPVAAAKRGAVTFPFDSLSSRPPSRIRSEERP